MATKPTVDNVRWATDETNNTAPSSGQRDTGWTPNQIAVSDYFNVLGLESYRWAAYLDAGVLEGKFGVRGAISPTGITGTINNWNPTGLATAAFIRATLSGDATITGLAGGEEGRIVTIVNLSTNRALRLTNSDTGSDADKRFLFDNQDGGVAVVDLMLHRGETATVWYDAVNANWRLLAHTGSVSRIYTYPPTAAFVVTGAPTSVGQGGAFFLVGATDTISLPITTRDGERLTRVGFVSKPTSTNVIVLELWQRINQTATLIASVSTSGTTLQYKEVSPNQIASAGETYTADIYFGTPVGGYNDAIESITVVTENRA